MRRTAPWLLPLALASLAPSALRAQESARVTDTVRVYQKASPAVIALRTTNLRRVPASVETDTSGRVHGLGTGIAIDPQGWVVTNYHVVEKANQIEAKTADGKEYSARLVDYDAKHDIALLKIESSDTFPYVPLADCKPMVGEKVVAIGNPYGLPGSVVEGIVSAIHREMKLPNGEIAPDLIQVGALINPGNSGGPLFTATGELLGMNAAIRREAQGIAFAIPVAKVREIVARLKPPMVSMDQVGVRLAESPRKGAGSSVMVTVSHVEPNSPAARAGLRTGDELVTAENQTVAATFDLHRLLWTRAYGEKIHVEVNRNGHSAKLALPLESKDASGDAATVWTKLGIWGAPVPASRVRYLNSKLEGGLLLLHVAPNGPAAEAGLKPGDIMLGIHGASTRDATDLCYMMAHDDYPKDRPTTCLIIRDGQLNEELRFKLTSIPATWLKGATRPAND
jgi:serine protease Do